MDNVLKLLLGVLGVSGMIAMVTSNLSFEPSAPPAAAQPPAIAAPVLTENSEEVVEEAVDEEFIDGETAEEDGDDIFAVGEPMIDGNPYGTNNVPQPQDAPQLQLNQPFSGNTNNGDIAQQNYGVPQPFSTPAPTESYVPAYNGQ
jgi:hypothetical protein